MMQSDGLKVEELAPRVLIQHIPITQIISVISFVLPYWVISLVLNHSFFNSCTGNMFSEKKYRCVEYLFLALHVSSVNYLRKLKL